MNPFKIPLNEQLSDNEGSKDLNEKANEKVQINRGNVGTQIENPLANRLFNDLITPIHTRFRIDFHRQLEP